MVLVNEMSQAAEVNQKYFIVLLKLLNPFAPHITEELWSRISQMPLAADGPDKLSEQSVGASHLCNHVTPSGPFLTQQPWPTYNPALVVEEEADYVVQINGRVRDQIKTPVDIEQDELLVQALASPKIQQHLQGAEPKKVVFVKGRLLNIVIEV